MPLPLLLACACALFDTQGFYRRRMELMDKERALRNKQRQLIMERERELPSRLNDPRWDEKFAEEQEKIRKEIADVREQIRQVNQQERDALRRVPAPVTTAEAPVEQQKHDAGQQDHLL
jgi:hypothetical protein